MPATSTQPAASAVEEVPRRFLDALARGDLDAAVALLDPDVAYTNISLPTVHGRDRVARLLGALEGTARFEVRNHTVAVDPGRPGRVLTERTDALGIGRVHWQFWVYGRFEVVDGRITVWRDSFDWADLTVGLVRGLLGAILPGAARRMPR